MGETHNRFLALSDEYGVRRFPSPAEGRTELLYNGSLYKFRGFFQGNHEGEPPGIPEADWRDATEAWQRFRALSEAMPSGHPGASEECKRLDADTVARWIEHNTKTEFGRWYFS